MNEPADPKFLQNDGDPIREAALPKDVQLIAAPGTVEDDASFVERMADRSDTVHVVQYDPLDVRIGNAAFDRLVALARRACTPAEPAAYLILDGTVPVTTTLTRDDAEGTVAAMVGDGRMEPLFRAAPGYREGMLRAAEIAAKLCDDLAECAAEAMRFGAKDTVALRQDEASGARQVEYLIRAEADALAPQPIPPEGIAAAQAALDRMAARAPTPEAERIQQVAKEFAKLGSDREQFGTMRVPNLTTPYTPRVVDHADGTSEFMLEDVPVVWKWALLGTDEAFAQDDNRFVGVRWPTRELPAPQPDAAPEPAAWQWHSGDGDWTDAKGSEAVARCKAALFTKGDVRPLYAAPPAPVPAGEVEEIVAEAINKARYDIPNAAPYRTLAESSACDREYCMRLARAVLAVRPTPLVGQCTAECLVRAEEIATKHYYATSSSMTEDERTAHQTACQEIAAGIRAALTAARPSADAGEVLEASFKSGDRVRWYHPPVVEGTVLKHNGGLVKVQWDTGEVRRDDPAKLRAALAVREPRS